MILLVVVVIFSAYMIGHRQGRSEGKKFICKEMSALIKTVLKEQPKEINRGTLVGWANGLDTLSE